MAQGKRVGPKKKRSNLRPATLLLSLGITVGVIAWGYLVKAAIDFGVQARNGDQDAWIYLGAASLGAVACLFIGLMLVARLLRMLGITSERPAAPTTPAEPPRPVGGRRASR
ncbi:hypothetical protein [Nocardioides euryhalodurans]|uniref:Uncharacterized protein n=1 Tax=Nocardioides euryhalodurans TaxID=2518370 RepID=A0A4P7GKG7_9ACTN|nr:hypothetical protein [Nocardioides euryhalodurans]QBR92279.1 hypothetical protein EXE57_08240 [Nocardioides euryhalodurans]